MYIKLGSTKINYRNRGTDDFIILSEVVDSSLSYEKPVLVRTTEELDIWFGEDFTDKDYFIELLKGGVTLYLYKPISPSPDTTSPDYIDFSNYDTIDILFYSTEQINKWLEEELEQYLQNSPNIFVIEDNLFLPTNEEVIEENLITSRNIYKATVSDENLTLVEFSIDRLIFKLVSEDGYYTENGLPYTHVVKSGDKFIYLDTLPQYLEFIPSSINNRDTLLIYESSNYISPSYNNSSSEFFEKKSYKIDLNKNLINYQNISENYQTLAFKLLFDNNFLSTQENEELYQYLVIRSISDNGEELSNLLIFSNEDEDFIENLDSFKKLTQNNNFIKYYNKITEDSKNVLKNTLIKLGYLDFGNDVFIAPLPCPVNYFYNLSGFSMIPEFRLTNDILYSLLDSDDVPVISFASKTIGTGGSLGNIRVTITSLKNNNLYRVELSRFNYTETFEGSTDSAVNTLRLDHRISRDSKLVNCLIYHNKKQLPEGTWYLRGGEDEGSNSDMYMKSLECIYNSSSDPVYFDYLLIPDIRKFTKPINKDLNYYKEYEKILEYSKSRGNQVLIQNTDYWEKVVELVEEPEEKSSGVLYNIQGYYFALVNNIWTEITDRELLENNSYKFNYTKDEDNILVYFYRSMEVYGKKRPGYYIYLDDLLFNDLYSPSTDYILYNTPDLRKDNYQDEHSSEENSLIQKKCNYLVENNHMYYYKKYQNGNSYNSTGWMRFCLGKISRELNKNKWWILSDNDVGSIRTRIVDILKRITSKFSIIRDIQLRDFKIDFKKNKIDLTIDTYMSDLVDNNIRIDITLNYYT